MNNLRNEVNKNDVLCGRGGTINSHSGNVQFRCLVVQQKDAYKQATNRFAKVTISDTIVKCIRNMNPPGRFFTEVDGCWVDIGDSKARDKVSQALREKKRYKMPLVTPCCKTKEDSQVVLSQDDQSFLTQNSSDGEDLDPLSSIDSWDQGIPLNDIEDYFDVKKFNSPKRILFREMKEEQTCLPLFSPESPNLRHENNLTLMRESLKTIDSTSMSSIEKPRFHASQRAEKQTAVDNTTLTIEEEMNLTHVFDNSLKFNTADSKMDSTDKLIDDAFMGSFKSFDVQYDQN